MDGSGSLNVRFALTAVLYGAPEYMAKRIAELTDNKFRIQLFAAGEIVPGVQVVGKPVEQLIFRRR